MAIKLHGQIIDVRGSNKKYPQLDDLDWLYAQLMIYSMRELADIMGIPRTSRNVIRHRVEKYFPEEWKATIKRERVRHTNKKGSARRRRRTDEQ